MNNQILIDNSDLRKYRTEIPNMADDELDPFQYRLYAHYKRVCGATNGTCTESVRTTAEKTKMSAEKVISTRKWLADNGWIDLEQQVDNRYYIQILDRWGENFVRYSEQGVRNSERPVRNSEQGVRNSEREALEIPNQRKNLYKKEPIKKEQRRDDTIKHRVGNEETTPMASASPHPSKAAEKKEKGPDLKQHAAVKAYHDFHERWPQAGQIKLITEAITDLDAWVRVLRAWAGKGYNPLNVQGMIDWYQNPKTMEAKTNGNTTASGSGHPEQHRQPTASDTRLDEFKAKYARYE